MSALDERRSDYRSIVLLTIGFGLVGFDRFMILPMLPVIAPELGLNYQSAGLITGVLSIAWGLSSAFMGNLSDRFGPRKIAVWSMFAFSLLVGVSGLASGLGSLLILRAFIGLLEGAFAPAALISNFESSAPSRIGRNVGIMQAAMPFFGLALAPIAVTQMLRFVPWHYVFALLSLPGFLVAYLLWSALRHVDRSSADREARRSESVIARWKEAFSFANVRATSFCICCWMSCLIVMSALMPGYLMDYRHLDLVHMGFVMSAIGFGATLGGLIMPGLSDRFGRKPVALVDAVGSGLSVAALMSVGSDSTLLFATLFLTSFFLYNLLGMTMSTMTAESVPEHVRTTATGVVIGIGEMFGSGVVPIVAGVVAHNFGIQYILHIALGSVVLGIIGLATYKETLPSRAREGTGIMTAAE